MARFLVLFLAACATRFLAPEASVVSCTSGDECPAGYLCAGAAQLCVPAAQRNPDAPAIFSAAAASELTVEVLFDAAMTQPEEPVSDWLSIDGLRVKSAVVTNKSLVVTTDRQSADKYVMRFTERLTDWFGRPLPESAREVSFTGGGDPPDRSPPRILSPAANQRALGLQATLLWAPVKGASQYRVEISESEDFAAISRSDDTSAETLEVTFAKPVTYFWRVRADVTRLGEYAVSSVQAMDNSVYVYCPGMGECPRAEHAGNQRDPLTSVKDAVVLAGSLGLAEVRVASRPGGAPYRDSFLDLSLGLALNGGYSSDFASRDVVHAKSVFVSSFSTGIFVLNPLSPVLLSGVDVSSADANFGDSVALEAQQTRDLLRVEDSTFRSGVAAHGASVAVRVVGLETNTERPTLERVNAYAGAGVPADAMSFTKSHATVLSCVAESLGPSAQNRGLVSFDGAETVDGLSVHVASNATPTAVLLQVSDVVTPQVLSEGPVLRHVNARVDVVEPAVFATGVESNIVPLTIENSTIVVRPPPAAVCPACRPAQYIGLRLTSAVGVTGPISVSGSSVTIEPLVASGATPVNENALFAFGDGQFSFTNDTFEIGAVNAPNAQVSPVVINTLAANMNYQSISVRAHGMQTAINSYLYLMSASQWNGTMSESLVENLGGSAQSCVGISISQGGPTLSGLTLSLPACSGTVEGLVLMNTSAHVSRAQVDLPGESASNTALSLVYDSPSSGDVVIEDSLFFAGPSLSRYAAALSLRANAALGSMNVHLRNDTFVASARDGLAYTSFLSNESSSDAFPRVSLENNMWVTLPTGTTRACVVEQAANTLFPSSPSRLTHNAFVGCDTAAYVRHRPAPAPSGSTNCLSDTRDCVSDEASLNEASMVSSAAGAEGNTIFSLAAAALSSTWAPSDASPDAIRRGAPIGASGPSAPRDLSGCTRSCVSAVACFSVGAFEWRALGEACL